MTASAPHNARRVGGKVFLSNDAGRWAFLSEADYGRYLRGELNTREDLRAAGLVRDRLDFGELSETLADKRLLRWPGPNVHTVVLTRRCNYKCLYCHASILDEDASGADMTPAVAEKAVDFIFSTPNPELMLEFQGGEPLLNWPVLKFIVKSARRRATATGRRLSIGLVSNFSLLDEAKIDFLVEHKVSFCASLDGPQALHDRNRLFLGGEGHARTVAWLRRIQERRAAGETIDKPNVIATVTRFSFPFYREIIDQVVDLGLERVQLGPLDPIGFARARWKALGYTAEEYLAFYEKALDHLVSLSRGGVRVYEKGALILLIRLLRGGHWRFPNGDALCRLAYNFDGGIFTCEEGRLLSHEGDDFFKVGDVASTSYLEVLDHPTVRASLMAAHTDAQPQCSQCAYAPHCSLFPVYNYRSQGSVWGQMPTNGWCRLIIGLFDLLVTRLEDPETRPVLQSWLEFAGR